MSFFKKIQIVLISLSCMYSSPMMASSPFSDIENTPGWNELPEEMKREIRAIQQLPPEEQEKILREAERMAETVRQMSPEEQEKLLRDVERIQKVVDEVGEDVLNRMSPEELNEFFEKALAQEEATSVAPTPSPEPQATAQNFAISPTDNTDLQQFLQFMRILSRHIDSFLLKADNILELHSKIERWSRKGTLRTWGPDATYNSVMNGVRFFNNRIHELTDVHTNQAYVQDVYKNEALKKTLLNVYTVLSTYERQIDANMFGMGDLGDTARDAILRILDAMGSVIKQQNIDAQFNTLKDAYKSAEEKAREQQLAIQKKAEDASKKPVRPKAATVAGASSVGEPYMPAYQDYNSGYTGGYSPNYSYPSGDGGSRPEQSATKPEDAKKPSNKRKGDTPEKKDDADKDKKKSASKKGDEKKDKDPLDELMEPLKKSCEAVRKELKKVYDWNGFLTAPTEMAQGDPAPAAIKNISKSFHDIREQLLALFTLKKGKKDDLKELQKRAQKLYGEISGDFKVLQESFEKVSQGKPKTLTKRTSRLKYITGSGTDTVQALIATKKNLDQIVKDLGDADQMAAHLPKPVVPPTAPAQPAAPAVPQEGGANVPGAAVEIAPQGAPQEQPQQQPAGAPAGEPAMQAAEAPAPVAEGQGQ